MKNHNITLLMTYFYSIIVYVLITIGIFLGFTLLDNLPNQFIILMPILLLVMTYVIIRMYARKIEKHIVNYIVFGIVIGFFYYLDGTSPRLSYTVYHILLGLVIVLGFTILQAVKIQNLLIYLSLGIIMIVFYFYVILDDGIFIRLVNILFLSTLTPLLCILGITNVINSGQREDFFRFNPLFVFISWMVLFVRPNNQVIMPEPLSIVVESRKHEENEIK